MELFSSVQNYFLFIQIRHLLEQHTYSLLQRSTELNLTYENLFQLISDQNIWCRSFIYANPVTRAAHLPSS